MKFHFWGFHRRRKDWQKIIAGDEPDIEARPTAAAFCCRPRLIQAFEISGKGDYGSLISTGDAYRQA